MVLQMTLKEVEQIAPAGYYIALRIGFAFPTEEVNCLPRSWVKHYTKSRLMLFDPVMRWAYGNSGIARWSDFHDDDTHRVIPMAARFGLRYGVAVSFNDQNVDGHRSFANFFRSDRDFSDIEAKLLFAYLKRRHLELVPPSNLTTAELEALTMFKDGLRLKQIAFNLSVTEGAVKQRLKNAKIKLNAQTSTQAATLARQFKLI